MTGLLFDAVLGELALVFGCQPRLIVGDFNVEPNLIPCMLKGIGLGLWVDFEEAYARATGKTPGVTCKMCFGSAGSRRDFMVACPLAAASLLSCEVVPERWIQLHFAVNAVFPPSGGATLFVVFFHVRTSCLLVGYHTRRNQFERFRVFVFEINQQIRIRFSSSRKLFLLSDSNFWCVQRSITCNETVHVHVL